MKILIFIVTVTNRFFPDQVYQHVVRSFTWISPKDFVQGASRITRRRKVSSRATFTTKLFFINLFLITPPQYMYMSVFNFSPLDSSFASNFSYFEVFFIIIIIISTLFFLGHFRFRFCSRIFLLSFAFVEMWNSGIFTEWMLHNIFFAFLSMFVSQDKSLLRK